MNGEVEIICIGDSAVIPDLGLTLSRGSRTNLSASNASRSKDLTIARAKGLVAVREVRVAILRQSPQESMTKPPDEDLLKKLNRLNRPNPAPPASESPELVAALRDLTREIAALRAEMQQKPAVSTDTSAIAEAVRSALSGLSFVAPTASGNGATTIYSGSPDEERFIPSGIVPTNLKADISPNTTNEGAGSLEDAQSALREARRRARET